MDSLQRLRDENPDVAEVLNAFGEIDRAYQEVLEAMGASQKPAIGVMNSAEVTVTFQHGASTSAS